MHQTIYYVRHVPLRSYSLQNVFGAFSDVIVRITYEQTTLTATLAVFIVPQMSCSAEGLLVWVQDQSFLCVRAGQLLSVNVRMNEWVYSGQLICPTCSHFCSQCPLPHELPPINTTRSIRIGITFIHLSGLKMSKCCSSH